MRFLTVRYRKPRTLGKVHPELELKCIFHWVAGLKMHFCLKQFIQYKKEVGCIQYGEDKEANKLQFRTARVHVPPGGQNRAGGDSPHGEGGGEDGKMYKNISANILAQGRYHLREKESFSFLSPLTTCKVTGMPKIWKILLGYFCWGPYSAELQFLYASP